MGSGNWTSNDWNSYSSTTRTRSIDQNFQRKTLDVRFDPKGIKVRESRDSVDHPKSTPIILGIDVTGSMGFIGQHLATVGLGEFVGSVLDKKPITDPQICVMAIGDANSDRAPIQVTQFESDIRIAEQLKDLFVEGGGGGNGSESYHFPWYIAGFKTSIDSFEKRNKKGYLFTVGDENIPETLTKSQIENFVGSTESGYTAKELHDIASERWQVFHVIVEEGDYCRRAKDEVIRDWTALLGSRAIPLDDHKNFSHVISAVIRVAEGEDVDSVVESFENSSIKNSIRHALKLDRG